MTRENHFMNINKINFYQLNQPLETASGYKMPFLPGNYAFNTIRNLAFPSSR